MEGRCGRLMTGGTGTVLALVPTLLAATPVLGFEGKTAPVDRRAVLPPLGPSAVLKSLVKFVLHCWISLLSFLFVTFLLDSSGRIFNFNLLWGLGTFGTLSLTEFVGFTVFEFTTLV